MGEYQIKNERSSVPRGPICFDVELLPERLSMHSRRLVLNANFRLEEFRIALGSLFVGITGGRLQLKFINGQFAKASHGEKRRALRPIPAPGKLQVTSATKTNIRTRPAAISNGGVATNRVVKHAIEHFDPRIHCASEVFLSAGGVEHAPYWDFESKAPKALRGDCLNEVLGEFSIADGEQCGEVHAEFVAPPRALWIAGSEDVWPARMAPNQRIVRRLLIWRWLRSRVKTRVRIVASGEQ